MASSTQSLRTIDLAMMMPSLPVRNASCLGRLGVGNEASPRPALVEGQNAVLAQGYSNVVPVNCSETSHKRCAAALSCASLELRALPGVPINSNAPFGP